jgi:acetoin utilization protein AcuB
LEELLRRKVYQLVAGLALTDRQLGAAEDACLARLRTRLAIGGLPPEVPLVDGTAAAAAMALLPPEVRRDAFEHALAAAMADGVVGGREARWLHAVATAAGISADELDTRLGAVGSVRAHSAPPATSSAPSHPGGSTSNPPTSGAGRTRVRDVMTADPIVVEPAVTVGAAYSMMKSMGFRHLPVVRDGELVGIISTNDIGRLGGVLPEIAERSVSELMTPDPITIGEDEPVEAAAATMALRKVNCLPVSTKGRLVGIVTTYDLLDALARRLRSGR